MLALSRADECLIVLSSGCHRHTFSRRVTAIYTYPADLCCLARTPGLLHSSPTLQEPSPVDILASYPRLTPESTPSFTVTVALLGCLCRVTPCSVLLVSAVSFACTTGDYYQLLPAMSAPSWQQPPCVLLYLSKLACDDCAFVAKTASRALTIINARPRCLRPRGKDRLTCY